MRKFALMATSVFSGCQMMAFVLYPYFAEATGLTLSSIIGSFSTGSFLFLWSSAYWARRSDALGRKKVLSIGLAGLLVSQLVLVILVLGAGFLTSAMAGILLWASRIVYGLTAAAVVPLAQTIMAESSAPAGRMQAMARHSMSLHWGRLIGPLVVWLGLLVSPAAPLWISVGLLLGLLVALARQPETKATIMVTPPPSRVDRSFIKQKSGLLGLALLLTILVGLLQSSLTQDVQRTLQLDARASAQLTLQFLLLASVVTLVAQALLRLKVKTPWQGTLPLGAFCMTVSSFLFATFSYEAQLWWALPLFALGVALLTPSYTAALSLLGEQSGQARVAGLLSGVHTLGYALGGWLAALLMVFHESPLKGTLLISFALLLLAFMVKAPSEHKLKILTRDHA